MSLFRITRDQDFVKDNMDMFKCLMINLMVMEETSKGVLHLHGISDLDIEVLKLRFKALGLKGNKDFSIVKYEYQDCDCYKHDRLLCYLLKGFNYPKTDEPPKIVMIDYMLKFEQYEYTDCFRKYYVENYKKDMNKNKLSKQVLLKLYFRKHIDDIKYYKNVVEKYLDWHIEEDVVLPSDTYCKIQCKSLFMWFFKEVKNEPLKIKTMKEYISNNIRKEFDLDI